MIPGYDLNGIQSYTIDLVVTFGLNTFSFYSNSIDSVYKCLYNIRLALARSYEESDKTRLKIERTL